MEDTTIEQEQKTEKEVVSGVPYPIESILTSIKSVEKVFTEKGTVQPVSKDEIAQVLGYKPASLVLTYSTWGQYGIVNNVRSKGYLPTPLFSKYQEKTYAYHEQEALLQMFKNAPLYSKLIDNLNGQQLPAEDKFQNILKAEPYNVNPNSAERAARVFYENLRELHLLDRFNKFVYSPHTQTSATKDTEDSVQSQSQNNSPSRNDNSSSDSQEIENEGLVKITVPFGKAGDGRQAFILLPRDYTNKDLKKIGKFLTALEDDDEDDHTKK